MALWIPCVNRFPVTRHAMHGCVPFHFASQTRVPFANALHAASGMSCRSPSRRFAMPALELRNFIDRYRSRIVPTSKPMRLGGHLKLEIRSARCTRFNGTRGRTSLLKRCDPSILNNSPCGCFLLTLACALNAYCHAEFRACEAPRKQINIARHCFITP